jgi:hypothetical protein
MDLDIYSQYIFLKVITNFPSPDADFAVLPLIAVAFLTNIPLYIVLLIRKVYKLIKNWMNKRKPNKTIESTLEESKQNDENQRMLTHPDSSNSPE